jgi:hypothetical protein
MPLGDGYWMWGSIAVSTREIKVSVESSYFSLGCAWMATTKRSLGTTSTNWPSLPMAAKAGWNPTSTSHDSRRYRASSIRVVASGPSVRARVAGHSNGPRRGRAARSWPCRAREAGSRMRRRIGPVCRSPSRIQPPQNGWSAGPATRNPCRPARVHAQRIEQLLPGVIQQGAGMVAVVAT